MGLEKSGEPGPNFQRGMAVMAKYVVIAEGVRGSLARTAIDGYELAETSDHPKYGIGFKELWRVPPEQHHAGRVVHSFGWPLDNGTGGGSYLYHLDDNQVAVGFVLHLNYKNPYLSPFEEFQRFKTHPKVRDMFKGGERLAYGSRAISEGGWQSVPRLVFPGGVIVGDSAGFVNVPRIKGSHNAVLSGILAADHMAAALASGRANDTLTGYDTAWRGSAIGHDLKRVRNVKPLWSRFGTLFGIVLGGFDMWCNQLFGLSLFGTLKPRQARPSGAGARRRACPHRLSQARWRADLRQAILGFPLRHQPCRPAVPPQAAGSRAAALQRAGRLCRSLDPLLPGRRL